jgi:transposase
LTETRFWNPPALSEKEAMPSNYPVDVRRQVVDLARTGTRVAQPRRDLGTAEATIYNWLKQDRIDRGEAPGLTTDDQMELTSARRRIRAAA